MKALLLALFALAVAVPAEAATKRKRHHQPHYAQQQIACMQFGCIPVQRGCYPTQGRTFSGNPSMFDVVVCPGGTLYGIR
jgi:hypothetical protein